MSSCPEGNSVGLDEKCRIHCIAFEEEFGSIEFMKMCGSAVNRLLVKKGLVTEDELRESIVDEIQIFKSTKGDDNGTGHE